MVGTRFYGRMGNVLFQAAHCIAYAMRHDLDFSMPNRTNNPLWNPLYLQHLVSPHYIQGREDILINERGHEYQDVEFREEWRHSQMVLNGYWQSEEYFKDYRSLILDLFDYPYEKREGYVAVHIRRGDYLHLTDKHPPVPKEWYELAMSKFPGYRFKFFSDDLQYCKNTFGDRSDCEFSSNTDEVQDMVEASCMEHDILSSSTYGWWIGWLNRNPDKEIYIPRLWFTEGYHLSTVDIVPPQWHKL